MAQFKSFEPVEGYEGLALEVHTDRVEKLDENGAVVLDSAGNPKFDRPEGAPLSISASEWPFTARSSQEERVLDDHPWLTEAQAEVDATEGARTLANANEVDLSKVDGTGEGGRVLVKDVEQFISESEAREAG